MSGKKKGIDPAKIQTPLRVMTVEFSQRARKESAVVESSQRLLVQSIQRLRAKAEILATATKFAQASRKVDAYTAVQDALTRIRDGASQLAQSKSPPPDLADALRTVCVVGDLLSIDSFAKFKSSVLRDLFSAAVLADLSDRTKLPEPLKFALFDETFSEQQILDAVKLVVQQSMRGDMTNYEKIFGQPPTNPNAPTEQQPLAKARVPTCQQIPPFLGQSQAPQRHQQAPSYPQIPSGDLGPSPPSLGKSMAALPPFLGQSQAPQSHQQAPSYPQIPSGDLGPSLPSYPQVLSLGQSTPFLGQAPPSINHSQMPSYPQIPSGDLEPSPPSQAPAGRPRSQRQQPPTAEPVPSAQPRLQYTKMGFVLPLINVPVFPREIWGQMVNELKAAIS
jgi:hypothetical protein